jgi:peptidoglycan/xylan/chitin deacetylase (PgdA/CDA1 family)
MSLAMSLRSRGPAGSAARTARVVARFGVSTASMARRLDRYDAITGELGIRPTWPTTACVLARHPEMLRRYAERGDEIAVHGLVHGDHALLDRGAQRESIARAAEIFERSGFHALGFRGPYLRYNDATLDVLRELGFLYHSSQAVSFPLREGALQATSAAETVSYELALKLYAAQAADRMAVIPRLRDGLIDMPVAIPDDEILVERLKVTEEAAAAQWLRILDLTYERGDLFTVQLHPERIDELGTALAATLAEARRRRPSVWIARLDEIAAWWLRRSRFSLRVARIGDGRYRVSCEADGDATLLVRGLEMARTPWYGQDALCRVPEFVAESPRIPVVGVSCRTPLSVGQFLAEEGMVFEISDDPGAYGAYLDVAHENWTEAEVLDAIDKAPGPLVRIWRWPSGARSALAVTGDIDALTLQDFALRSWETRKSAFGGTRS